MAEGPTPPVLYGDPETSVRVALAPIANMRNPPGLLPLVKATVSPTYTTALVRSTATEVSPPPLFFGLTVLTEPNGLPVLAELKGITAKPEAPMATKT